MADRLSPLFDGFLDHLRYRLNRSENTVVNYAADLAQFAEFQQKEYARWKKVIETGKITIDGSVRISVCEAVESVTQS